MIEEDIPKLYRVEVMWGEREWIRAETRGIKAEVGGAWAERKWGSIIEKGVDNLPTHDFSNSKFF